MLILRLGDNLETGLVSGKLLEPAVKPAMKHHIPATIQSPVSRDIQHNMQSAVGSRDSQINIQSAVGSRDRQAVTAGNTVRSLRNGHSGQVGSQSGQQVVPAGSRSRRSQSRDRLERHTIPICKLFFKFLYHIYLHILWINLTHKSLINNGLFTYSKRK